MAKELTVLNIERQNILNNKYAVEAIIERIDFHGMLFDGEYRYTKAMVAKFYGVDERTIERYIEKYSEELKHNGYFLCRGKSLKEFKLHFLPDIYVGKNTPQLGLFNFRAFLNIGMLLTESENGEKKWHLLRQRKTDRASAKYN